MDIVKFALKMELDGKQFYEAAAAKASTKELKDIFLYLAQEEERHFQLLQADVRGEDRHCGRRA